MVNKLTLPAKENEVQSKINELVDSKQDLLTAGDGINIAGNIISTNNIFWVEYQTTTYSDIMAAWNAGKIILMLYSPSGTDSILFLCERLYWSRFYFNTVTNNKQIYNVTLDWNNNWYLSATLLQSEIPAGTSGDVVTYSGTAGTIGSTTLAKVATSGSYNDLSNKPTIPTVNNATLTITQGGTTKGTFTANASSDVTIDLDAGGTSSIDNKSITLNTNDELQTVGVIDSRNSSTAIKTWTGTRSQYEAILTKDVNTLYNITDDTDVTLTILEALYPVGSVFETTNSTCPLSTLISGSTWIEETSRILVDKYVDGTNWWNLYSDGWCEQGGYFNVGSVATAAINLFKAYPDTNYSIYLTNLYETASTKNAVHVMSVAKTDFTYWSENTNGNVYWRTCGYTSTTTNHKRFRRVA